jgi:hypothetical protein
MMGEHKYIVRQAGPETRFVLPARERRRLHVAAGSFYALAAVGLFCLSAYVLFWKYELTAGVWLAAWGIAAASRAKSVLVRGHGELWVWLENDELRTAHRAGGRAGWDSFEATEIERLEIGEDRVRFGGLATTESVLEGEYADGTRVTLAREYPRALLEALAGDLRPLLEQARARAGREAQAVEVVDVSGIPARARDVLRQPADSRIVAAHAGDVHSYVIPRWGILGTVPRFVVFSLLPAGLAAAAGAVIFAMLDTPAANRPPETPTIVGGGCCAIGIAAAIWMAGLHFFLRRAVIVISGEGPATVLTRVTKGLLGSRTQVWQASAIASLSTDTHATSNSFRLASNDMHQRLFLKPAHGRRRILAEGSEYEMRWLATELRRLLGVANVPP